jgi:hypothetical protein
MRNVWYGTTLPYHTTPYTIHVPHTQARALWDMLCCGGRGCAFPLSSFYCTPQSRREIPGQKLVRGRQRQERTGTSVLVFFLECSRLIRKNRKTKKKDIMATSVRNTTGQPNNAALEAIRLEWAKQAASHASPIIPPGSNIALKAAPPRPRPGECMVPLDCGHWVDWRTCMSQKECPQCSAPVPSRLDKFVHEKAKSFWKASLYPTAPLQSLLRACYRYLTALPMYSRVTHEFPLNMHEEDVYWRMKCLLVRVLLELTSDGSDEGDEYTTDTVSKYLLDTCGGSARK